MIRLGKKLCSAAQDVEELQNLCAIELVLPADLQRIGKPEILFDRSLDEEFGVDLPDWGMSATRAIRSYLSLVPDMPMGNLVGFQWLEASTPSQSSLRMLWCRYFSSIPALSPPIYTLFSSTRPTIHVMFFPFLDSVGQ